MLINIFTAMTTFILLAIPAYGEDFNYLSIAEEGLLSHATDEDRDLYQQIFNEFNLTYEAIGKTKAESVLLKYGPVVITELNSIGFSYERPFMNFGVRADRNLAPDLFDDKRWIVTDTFTVNIDASKIIGELRDDGSINMSEENFAAFAGIVFKRKFTWVHYANSYEEGLTTHFEKLFLPFNTLKYSNVVKLGSNEMIFKEDSISVKAGGIVSAPLYSGVMGTGGVLAKFEKLNRLEVVSFGDSKIQISSEKSNIGSLGFNLTIQADFLKILRMTLLSYDLNYELESSYKIYLDINQLELRSLSTDAPVAIGISKLLKNREVDLNVLAPYMMSEEKKISQTIKHKYNFLLLGAQKNSKTQKIEITKDGKVKSFFRHYYEKMKYTEGALSRLFSSLVFAVTNSDISTTQLASDTKKVTIEYDSERNLLESRESLNIQDELLDEQKISMTFKSDFRTQKTTGKRGRKFKERAVFILERFSGVDPLALEMIARDYLKAPYHIQGNYQVNIDGIRFFNKQSIDNVFNHFDGLCNEYPKKRFLNFRNLFDNCRKSLQNDYIDYIKDLTHEKISSVGIQNCEKRAGKYFLFPSKKRAFIKNCLSKINLLTEQHWVNIPLWPLKNLSNNIVENSYSKVHFYNLFGVQNVFFFGSFDAVASDGRAFTTNFHEGAFKGLGAVDHYMRIENLRAPSSVVLDQ